MASQQELDDLILEEVENLEVHADLSDLEGRYVVLHDSEGNPIAFSASVLANIAATAAIQALARRVTALEDKTYENLTQAQYNSLVEAGTIVNGKWYMVFGDSDFVTLNRIYIGYNLFAQRASGTSKGFPYALPMTF